MTSYQGCPRAAITAILHLGKTGIYEGIISIAAQEQSPSVWGFHRYRSYCRKEHMRDAMSLLKATVQLPSSHDITLLGLCKCDGFRDHVVAELKLFFLELRNHGHCTSLTNNALCHWSLSHMLGA
eukprot:6455990-Amphidinium_carterae.1